MTAHVLALVTSDERPHEAEGLEWRHFRAECSCGWSSAWRTTNACMGNGRRHLAAVRRAAS